LSKGESRERANSAVKTLLGKVAYGREIVDGKPTVAVPLGADLLPGSVIAMDSGSTAGRIRQVGKRQMGKSWRTETAVETLSIEDWTTSQQVACRPTTSTAKRKRSRRDSPRSEASEGHELLKRESNCPAHDSASRGGRD